MHKPSKPNSLRCTICGDDGAHIRWGVGVGELVQGADVCPNCLLGKAIGHSDLLRSKGLGHAIGSAVFRTWHQRQEKDRRHRSKPQATPLEILDQALLTIRMQALETLTTSLTDQEAILSDRWCAAEDQVNLLQSRVQLPPCKLPSSPGESQPKEISERELDWARRHALENGHLGRRTVERALRISAQRALAIVHELAKEGWLLPPRGPYPRQVSLSPDERRQRLAKIRGIRVEDILLAEDSEQTQKK